MSRSAMHNLWLLCLLAAAPVVGGCPKKAPPTPPPQPEPTQQQLTPERADALRQALVAWFKCEECTDGELKAVVAFGPVAVPSLAATLNRGPSPAASEEARLHLQQTYRELKAYERTHPDNKVPQDEAAYVSTYLENLDAAYRGRAAKALGAIGGPEATQALVQAKGLKLRDDVTAAVQAALQPGK